MTTFALEKYRVFPYIAWSLIISFSWLVFNLTTNAVAEMKAITDNNNTHLSQSAPSPQVTPPPL